MMRNPYEVLGVEKDCQQGEITKAFRKKAQKCHPDKEGGSDEAFQEVNRAYQQIGTVEARKDFDEGKTPLPIEEVRNTLFKSMRAALAENPLEKVLPRLMEFLVTEIHRNKANILRLETSIKTLRANASRMSVKGERPNLFEQAINAEIENKEADVASAQSTVAMLQAMKDELRHYEEGEPVYERPSGRWSGKYDGNPVSLPRYTP